MKYFVVSCYLNHHDHSKCSISLSLTFQHSWTFPSLGQPQTQKGKTMFRAEQRIHPKLIKVNCVNKTSPHTVILATRDEVIRGKIRGTTDNTGRTCYIWTQGMARKEDHMLPLHACHTDPVTLTLCTRRAQHGVKFCTYVIRQATFCLSVRRCDLES